MSKRVRNKLDPPRMRSLSVKAPYSLGVNVAPIRRHLCLKIGSAGPSAYFYTRGYPVGQMVLQAQERAARRLEQKPAVAPSAVRARVADISPDNQRPRSPKSTALVVRAAHLGLRARPRPTSASWATSDEFAFYLWQLPWELYATLRRIRNDAEWGERRTCSHTCRPRLTPVI
ncbi:hypothetical protein MTO96_023214 [Rhipicephalus appendiculatus]